MHKKEATAEPQPELTLKEREVVALELAAIHGREWLTAQQAATYLGISLFSLQELGRNQQIPCSKPNKFRFYRKADLDAWMAGSSIAS